MTNIAYTLNKGWSREQIEAQRLERRRITARGRALRQGNNDKEQTLLEIAIGQRDAAQRQKVLRIAHLLTALFRGRPYKETEAKIRERTIRPEDLYARLADEGRLPPVRVDMRTFKEWLRAEIK